MPATLKPALDWIAVPRKPATELGVRAQTLYAYVSRGRVQGARRSTRSTRAAASTGPPTSPRSRAAQIAQPKGNLRRWRPGAPSPGASRCWPRKSPPWPAGGCSTWGQRRHPASREAETLESVACLLRGGHGAALEAHRTAPGRRSIPTCAPAAIWRSPPAPGAGPAGAGPSRRWRAGGGGRHPGWTVSLHRRRSPATTRRRADPQPAGARLGPGPGRARRRPGPPNPGAGGRS